MVYTIKMNLKNINAALFVMAVNAIILNKEGLVIIIN